MASSQALTVHEPAKDVWVTILKLIHDAEYIVWHVDASEMRLECSLDTTFSTNGLSVTCLDLGGETIVDILSYSSKLDAREFERKLSDSIIQGLQKKFSGHVQVKPIKVHPESSGCSILFVAMGLTGAAVSMAVFS